MVNEIRDSDDHQRPVSPAFVRQVPDAILVQNFPCMARGPMFIMSASCVTSPEVREYIEPWRERHRKSLSPSHDDLLNTKFIIHYPVFRSFIIAVPSHPKFPPSAASVEYARAKAQTPNRAYARAGLSIVTRQPRFFRDSNNANHTGCSVPECLAHSPFLAHSPR